MKLAISVDADADLAEIAHYTKKKWGKAQARDYANGLISLLNLLPVRPNTGRPMIGVPDRFLKATYRSHHIYYVLSKDTVTIARVLHQSRDAPRHLL